MKLWLLTIVGVVSTSMVLAASVAVAQTPIFSDDLSVGTGWTYSHIGGTSKPVPPSGGGSDNVEADFGFDYSQFGIPEAPNSDAGDPATQGLRLADNLNGFFDDEGIAVVYEDASFAGQYTVQVDAWLNWAADPVPWARPNLPACLPDLTSPPRRRVISQHKAVPDSFGTPMAIAEIVTISCKKTQPNWIFLVASTSLKEAAFPATSKGSTSPMAPFRRCFPPSISRPPPMA